MRRCYQIKENLYLVEETITLDETPKDPEPTNHIWIYDRSWSMCGELPQLVEDMIEKAKEIPIGDTVSLGWFSGEGQYDFILKGFKVTEKKDYKLLEKAIRNNKRPVSCTCFSEILADTKKVIKDLSIFSDKFALLFLSDGYPVVSNYQKEITNIFKAIEAIEGKVASSAMIGYGNYYNRDLMMRMAESFGGALIHNDDLNQFKITVTDLINNSLESDGKIEVNILYESDLIFNYNWKSKTINIYKKREDGTVRITPSKDKTERVFLLTKELVGLEEDVVLNENVLKRPTDREPIVKAVYAAAYLLNQKARTDEAMELLASIGDAYLVEQLNNAFTNTEYGFAEEQIKNACFNNKRRYQKGYVANYLPAENAFCLLDVIDLLMGDKESFFFPQKINYKRVGQATKPKKDYPKFTAEQNVRCSFDNFSWHQEKLNLSVLAKIPGHIDLSNTEYKKMGFGKEFPTFIFRNYTVVKDGFLNIKEMEIVSSSETFEILSKNGLVASDILFTSGVPYVVNLSAVPIMNRQIAKNNKSAIDLCKNLHEELELKAQLKVLNAVKKDLAEKEDVKDDIFKGLSEEQVEFLMENGITKNGFSPEVEKQDPVDFYYAKHFRVKAKGFSSIPKISDVQKKIASGKKLRPVDALVQKGLNLVDNSPVANQSNKVKLAWLDDKSQELKKKMLGTRSKIQRSKFATLLGKQWYDEFDSREDCALDVDGVNYQFAIEEKKVWI